MSTVHSQPRVLLFLADGGFSLADVVLPSLDAVKVDVIAARRMRNTDASNPSPVLLNSLVPGATFISHGSLERTRLISNLFKFSYFVDRQGVPEDIVDDVIWALALYIRIREECPEAVLNLLMYTDPDSHSKYTALFNARAKICLLLLQDAARPRDALPYAKSMVDEEGAPKEGEGWTRNFTPFQLYGEALVLTRADDDAASQALRRAAQALVAGSCKSIDVSVRNRTFLARALRNVGADEQAKAHESWLVNWFRKNPILLPEDDLRYFLLPAGPVLTALGGTAWLAQRKTTSKGTQRQMKYCRSCGAREPLVTLLLCANCQHVYYCSKTCQKSDWKKHKDLCREATAQAKEIAAMRETDPEGAKREEDFKLWCNSFEVNKTGIIDALGLHRDRKRGRTHIVLRFVEHMAGVSKVKDRFRVRSCGVFRIAEVLGTLESIMGLSRTEIQKRIDETLSGVDNLKQMVVVPFLNVSVWSETSGGVAAWLGGGSITLYELQQRSYDRDWRKRVNTGSLPPPLPIMLIGVEDVEDIF